ncbi:MAG: hypothetical protein J6T46_03210 [Victivallales bacterium]|nr:hypothetical protein [Victivallales bacterium]
MSIQKSVPLYFAGGFEKVSILNILNKVKDSSWPIMGFYKNIVGQFGKDKLNVQTKKAGIRHKPDIKKLLTGQNPTLELIQ